MHILMVSRATLFSSPGGDTVQVVETAGHLQKLGVAVDIKLTNEKIDYSAYDLIHFFNIIRPADILRHIRLNKLPFVVSTIFLDYEEAEKMNQQGWRRLVNTISSSDQIEYLKVIARWLLNGEPISHWSYLVKGQRRAIRHIITKAGYLLPNSDSEYDRLVRKYKSKNAYVVVPNGSRFFSTDEECKVDRDYVLCVARIENRKNQLGLIKALSKTDYKLIIIGKPSPNHKKYYRACRLAANEHVTFVDRVEPDQLRAYYAMAKVHVLPSWFETTGLASLEAAAMGCNIVVTRKGDTEEYFQDDAFYCDPSDEASIREAVNAAFEQPYREKLRERIFHYFTWEKAAEATLRVYNNMSATPDATVQHSIASS